MTESGDRAVTSKLLDPFALMVDFGSGALEPHTSRTERHASDMQGAYADAAALSRLVKRRRPARLRSPPVRHPRRGGAADLLHDGSPPGDRWRRVLHDQGPLPLRAGHGEVYLGLSGHGYLLLMTEEGGKAATPMGPGTVAYVPPCWAHRTVNTAEEPFVFLAVYPGQAGHDYGTIEQTGFPQRVLRTPQGAVLR